MRCFFLAMMTLVTAAPFGLAAPPAPPITAAAYDPQGKVVAIASTAEVRVLDPQSGDVLRRITSNTGRITALAVSPDARILAIATGDAGKSGFVHFHQIAAADNDDRPPVKIAVHSDTIHAVAFSRNSRFFASAGYDRVIHVHDVSRIAEGRVERTQSLKDHSDAIYDLSFHPGLHLLASASADRTVKVWDVETGKRLYTLAEATDWLHAVAWSPDRKHLAAAGVDRSIRIWAADRDGGKLVHSVFAHAGPVWRIGYRADGQVLYSVGEDRVIKSWDAAKMIEQRTFPAQPDHLLALAVRPDGKQLAIGRFDGVGELWDADTGQVKSRVFPARPLKLVADRLAPAAVVRGQVTRLVVLGKNLDDVKTVTASRPGITIEPKVKTVNRLELEVKVPLGMSAGAIQIMLTNDAGPAAPLTCAIDRYPAIPEVSAETESPRRAMPITVPGSVAGAIDRAGDVDYFRFEAQAGQQIGVQVVAAELGSKLDPVLVLTNSQGQVLAESTTGVLGARINSTGTHALAIRDRDFRGGPDFNYRLQIGDVPVVTSVFPLAVPRGRTTPVHLEGVNLGSGGTMTIMAAPPRDATVGSKLTLSLPTTASGEPVLGMNTVMVDEWPAVVVDPNNGAELRVPGAADGILNTPGSVQNVRFMAKKGDRLIVEVLARRAGSPVDSLLTLHDANGQPVPRAVLRSTAKIYTIFRDHDSATPGIRLESWNELAMNDYLYVDGELMRIFALPRNPDDDCQFYQFAGQRLGFLDTTPSHHSLGSPMYRVEIHPPGRTFPPNGLPVFPIHYRNDDGGPGYGKDSRLFFDVPADGIYQARISDSRGLAGPNFVYRVTIRPPRPDFTISATPAAPSIGRGSGIPLSITATRIDGFDGPIQLEFQNLPAGLHAPATFIEAGHTTTAIALFAQPDAMIPTSGTLTLVARATINGQVVSRDATITMPKLIDPGDIVTRTRDQIIRIQPGQETRFVVDVERRGDFKGRIPLEVRGLPHGVRVLNVGLNGILVTERDTSREIVMFAEPWVQPMNHPIVIVARSERKGTEHAAKSVMLRVEK